MGMRIAGIFCTSLWCGAAAAQVAPPSIERLDRPGGIDLAPPEFRKPSPSPPPLQLPPITPQVEPGGLAPVLRVRVREIRVQGSTVFSHQQLRDIVAPFENRELASEDLDEVRHRVSLAYANAGYVNSGAVLPDQDLRDGVVVLQVIEGRLTEIRVAGENTFWSEFIPQRIAPGAGTPLNVRDLQETIQILLQNPQIERVNAELAPGTQRGEAVLNIDVKEAKRLRVGFLVANNRSPAVGAARAELSAAVNNLTGLGDSLALRVGKSDGQDDQGFSFSVPVTPRDTLLLLRTDRTRSRVVEGPFTALDVKNESRSWELILSQPVYRTQSTTAALGVGYYHRKNSSSLLGVPFSFVPGIADGNATVAAVRLYGDFLDRTQDSVLAARLTYTSGLRSGGATTSVNNTPDSQYATTLAQAQWARRLSDDGKQVLLRADYQRASGELLPSEKFSIGGSETVRGYRENQLVRDNAWVASAEYRHPLGRLPIPPLKERDQDGEVYLAAFVDGGRGWDHFGGDKRTIWSVGLGLRWDIAEGISAQVYRGFRRTSVEAPAGHDLQDRGIHFRVAAARAF